MTRQHQRNPYPFHNQPQAIARPRFVYVPRKAPTFAQRIRASFARLFAVIGD